MLKGIVTTLQVLVGVYFMGNIARQNPKFKAFIVVLEDRYGNLNNKIKDARLTEGIIFLQLIYGFVAIISAIMFFLMTYVVPEKENVKFLFSMGFVFGFIGWASVSWCMQHRKAISENAWIFLLMVVSPFALALLEKQSGISLIRYTLEPLFHLFKTMGFHVDIPTGIWSQAGILSCVLLFVVLMQYIFSWILSIPVLLITIFIVISMIFFARLVNLIAPEKSFPGFMIILFILLTVVQNYLL